ncbi:MAG: spondin domain-containing protein [Rubricoccaceae bacterium]|nr:spondin domain-containing protein [Rubricoccaceae bacterium]
MRCFLLLLALAAPAAAAQGAATYRVTFEATWSEATHPVDFPPDPHFSGLVGATHEATASLWAPGELASAGIESMAETGSKTLLIAEAEALIAGGQAEAVLSGGGIAVSPGSVSLDLEVSAAYSHVSLVSMLAPSPDWFVGVHGLDLYEGGTWAAERVVDLHVYDSGTDSGATYTAPDDDTNPPEPLAQHVEPPFLVGGEVPPVGTFTFTLLSTTAAETAPAAEAFRLDAPYPNPTVGPVTISLHLADPQPVQVVVYDALGRRVAVLHEGSLPAGAHLLTLDTAALPRGVYVVRAVGTERVSRRVAVR